MSLSPKTKIPLFYLAFFFVSALSFERIVLAGPPARATEILKKKILPSSVLILTEGSQLYRRKPFAVRMPNGRVGIIQRLVKIDAAKSGTGIIVSGNGLILTNAHNVLGLKSIKVKLYNGRVLDGEIVRVIPEKDFAIISVKPQEKLEFVRFADSSLLNVGDTVFAVANPKGEGNDCFGGRVIELDKKLFWKEKNIMFTDLIATDLYLVYGSSGGALINSHGELIGMNVAGHIFIKGSYAIPSNIIKGLYDKYLEER